MTSVTFHSPIMKVYVIYVVLNPPSGTFGVVQDYTNTNTEAN
jgi:hypothetical protein